MVQRWMTTHLDDENVFPTDPLTVMSSLYPGRPTGENDLWLGARAGFPEKFHGLCRCLFRHLFRVYAHMYWSHFTEPLYNLSLERHLNSCFCYFLHTAAALDLMDKEDVRPMQHFIDLWAADGTFAPESRIYAFADPEVGDYLLALCV